MNLAHGVGIRQNLEPIFDWQDQRQGALLTLPQTLLYQFEEFILRILILMSLFVLVQIF